MTASALILVTTSFPIANDGSESAGSFVSDLAEELACHCPVRVVAPGTLSGHETWAPNVEVFRYASPAKPLSTLRLWHPADMLVIARVLQAGMKATQAAVKAGPTMHIFALWALPSGEWARRVGRKHGVGYSVWMLGSDVWSFGRVPVLRQMLGRVVRRAQYAYADGYQLAEDAQRITGRSVTFLASTRKILMVNPPLPHAQPPYRLLFLGRWHPNKGVDLLLDALAQLDEKDWRRIECVEIQGGGPMEDLVRERVAALQAAGRQVHLGGFLVKQDAELAIARADWVLIPSRIESIPVVFSDAMKLGRPVISSPVGDLPHLLEDSGCGELAEDASAVMFCHAIQKALAVSTRSFDVAVRSQAAHFNLVKIAAAIHAKVVGDG